MNSSRFLTDPLLTQAQNLGTALFTSPEYVNGDNTDFVTDLYWAYLQRAPDQGGLDFWVYQLQGFDPLLTQAQNLGTALFTAPEYFNGDNTDFVTDLYWAYLQRAPDQGGLDFWVYQLTYNGASREAVRGEFARSRSSIAPGSVLNAALKLGFIQPNQYQEQVNLERAFPSVLDSLVAAGCLRLSCPPFLKTQKIFSQLSHSAGPRGKWIPEQVASPSIGG